MRLLLPILFLLVGCQMWSPENCTVTDTPEGAVIRCPTGTKVTVTDGKDGHNAVILTKDCAEFMEDECPCVNGGLWLVSATDTNDNGHLDFAGDTNYTSAWVCNGVDGEDGQDAILKPIVLIDPCGKESELDEILVCLPDQTGILASVSDKSNGQNTRFSILVDGRYETTDGTYCKFEVQNLNVTWAKGSASCD